MSSVDEASGAVGGNAEEARRLAAHIAASKEVLDQLDSALATVGAERRATEAGAASQDAEALAAQAAGLADALDTLRARIEALRGLLPNTSSGTPPSAEPGSPGISAGPRLENFNAQRPDPRCIAAIKAAGWPTNREGRTSARAYLYAADGRQLNAEPLKAYPPGQAPIREDLKEPWASDESMTTTWHVEGDAAAKIRSDRLDGAAFYLNVPLCGVDADTRVPDPQKCAANFGRIIPEDTTVYVHVVPRTGLSYRQKIIGTGEGIKERE